MINPRTVLVDSRGIEWRPSLTFQDQEVGGTGWLLMRSSDREELTYADVVTRYGIRDGRIRREGEDRPYLLGYIENLT